MIKTIFGPWVVYAKDLDSPIDPHKCGKWMYFSSDIERIIELCTKAIEEDVVVECKHSYELDMEHTEYLACFYIDGTNEKAHKRVIQFFLDNDMIRKKKDGSLYDLSFKFDDQTRAGEYGVDFEGRIKLHEFLDLKTGKWLK